jgi:hypothetical protein
MNIFETPADNALTGNGDGVSVFVRATKEDEIILADISSSCDSPGGKEL